MAAKILEVSLPPSELWDWPLEKNDGVVRLVNKPELFEVSLNVPGFKPTEIEVKVLHDELLIVCQHDEREDQHGRVSREIKRTYRLPGGVDVDSLRSVLHRDGVLVISAGKK